MPLIAGAMVGSALISGGLGYFGAKDASKKQYDAAMQGLSLQEQIYAKNSANLQPYMDLGAGGASSLASLYGLPGSNNPNGQVNWDQFLNTPDYQFTQQQGMRALDMSAASKGMLLSGAQSRASQTFGQGLASQQFGNYFQRMLSLAGLGNSAASALAGVGTNAGIGMSNSYGNAGQASAAGTVGGINAITGSLGTGVNNLMLYSALNKSPSSYGTPMNITPPTVGAPGLGNTVAGQSAPGGGGLGAIY